MKYRSTPIILAASLALAAGSHAATIVWNGSFALTGVNDVRANTANETTKFAFVPLATSATSVNGVSFTNTATQNGITLGQTNVGGFASGSDSNQLNGVATIGSSSAYATMLSSAAWHAGNSGTTTTKTLTFTGLTTDQKYEIRLWAADYRNWGVGRNESVGGYTLDYNDGLAGATGSTTGGGYIVGTFIADAGTQAFTLTAGGGSAGTAPANNSSIAAQFNAVQLSAIPEPSAALLGGLGMLFLLRRRR